MRIIYARAVKKLIPESVVLIIEPCARGERKRLIARKEDEDAQRATDVNKSARACVCLSNVTLHTRNFGASNAISHREVPPIFTSRSKRQFHARIITDAIARRQFRSTRAYTQQERMNRYGIRMMIRPIAP